MTMRVTIDEVLMGREKEYPLDEQKWRNLCALLVSINKLRDIWRRPMIVTSGYRPGHYNTDAGGSETSAHLSCEAIDISDKSGALKNFLSDNKEILADLGLYMEHGDSTPTWCHLQTRKTRNRIFRP